MRGLESAQVWVDHEQSPRSMMYKSQSESCEWPGGVEDWREQHRVHRAR